MLDEVMSEESLEESAAPAESENTDQVQKTDDQQAAQETEQGKEDSANEDDGKEKQEPSVEAEGKSGSNFIDFDDPESFTKEKVKARIDELTRTSYDKDSKLSKLELELKDTQKQLRELKKPQAVQPPNPEDRDVDPEKFAADEEAYKAYLKDEAKYENESEQLAAQEKQEAENVQQEQVQEFQVKATEAGIDLKQLAHAEQVVASQLPEGTLGATIASELMNEPQLVMELATKPMQLSQVLSGGVGDAIRELDKIKNSLIKPKQSETPQPAEKLKAGSSTDTVDEYGEIID